MTSVGYHERRLQGLGIWYKNVVVTPGTHITLDTKGYRNLSLYVRPKVGCTIELDTVACAHPDYETEFGTALYPEINVNQDLGSIAADGTLMIDLTGTVDSKFLNFPFLRFKISQRGTVDVYIGGKI